MKARAAALLLLGLAACPRLDPMQRQQKAKAYQSRPSAPDALAMRHPPAGTVQHGPLLPPEVATGVGADGRAVAVVPLEITPALLARGHQRFEIVCAACHGLLGDGESQVARNMSLRPPPSLHAYRDVPDGHIFRVITHGFGLMPSYAPELTVEERWAIVAYVRALQLSQYAKLDQLPPDARDALQKEGR